jgi:D-alanyl-D-alanine carboxypeptidase
MLYPLLLESSNDAAEALAESGGRSSFMSDMNSKADSLGLNHTRFLDPSGLSSGNTSTVSDLFALMQYINEFREDLFDITQLKKYRSEFYNKTWYSNSRFKNDTAYIGGKNGYTDEARKTQAAIFQLPLEGNDGFRNIAIILLNGKDTTSDIRGIISFLNEFVYYE